MHISLELREVNWVRSAKLRLFLCLAYLKTGDDIHSPRKDCSWRTLGAKKCKGLAEREDTAYKAKKIRII